MFQQIAFTAILIATLTVTSNGQPQKYFKANTEVAGNSAESMGGLEAASAVTRLGDLTPDAIRERLQQMRQTAYVPGLFLVNKIVESKELPSASSKRIDQLKVALQPVLDYHERGQMPIYVLRSEQPKAYLVERSVIIITTRLMVIASDEEIRGIVAHELAHEYIWDERVKAMKEKDGQLMRECELFCDAVAAFTLKVIGDEPASYGRILQRLTIMGSDKGSTTTKQSDTHPSLDTRIKLNRFLCQRFDLNLKKTSQL